MRAIGETFRANPANGTATLSLPVPMTEARFQPKVQLSYDSGSGNGPFGLGWSLDLSVIARRTDKRLPQGFDHRGSDVFSLSGAEDLVPLLAPGAAPQVQAEGGVDYDIHPYRPRVEQGFNRIERWHRRDASVSHWRVWAADNLLSIYGLAPGARLADPADPSRIHSWHLEASYDSFGNAVHVRYKHEDEDGLSLETADPARGRPVAWLYPKSLRYGFRQRVERGAALSARADHLFEVIFDYGEHGAEVPTPAETGTWKVRHDAFSAFRPGFETRCRRLCRRILLFHHVPEDAATGADSLVRSLSFDYAGDDPGADPARGHPAGAQLRRLIERGHKRRGAGYVSRSLPTLQLDYTESPLRNAAAELGLPVTAVEGASLRNLPEGVGGAWRFVDLDGDGVPGILYDAGGALYVKRNLSPLDPAAAARFGALTRLDAQPAAAMPLATALVTDIDNDGEPEIVQLAGSARGYYDRGGDDAFAPFRPFESLPPKGLDRQGWDWIDLDGDGLPELVAGGDGQLNWFPAMGARGFGPARDGVVEGPADSRGFRLGTDPTVFTADMTGDGLADIVRIDARGVRYWPNLGHGRFAAARILQGTPVVPRSEDFDPTRLRLVDIDGTGPSDIIYLAETGPLLFRNLSGNSLAPAIRLTGFPPVHGMARVDVLDLLGTGTACLVWSSPLAEDADRPLRYVDLSGGTKPNLLARVDANNGAVTELSYRPSTHYTVADREAGLPVLTRMPFPVHVLAETRSYDRLSGSLFLTRYSYRHPAYDPVEREPRGFAFVEQWDSAAFDSLAAGAAAALAANWNAASHVAPVRMRTWFHTGLADDLTRLLPHIERQEVWQDPGRAAGEALRPEVASDLSPGEWAEALRALRGRPIRIEVAAPDGTPAGEVPYSVEAHGYTVRRLVSAQAGRPAVMFAYVRETRRYTFERDPSLPRIEQDLALEVDPFGNVLRKASVAHGRQMPDLALAPTDQARQARRHCALTLTEMTPAIALGGWRTPMPFRIEALQLHALPAPATRLYHFDEIAAAVAAALADPAPWIDPCDPAAAEAAAAGAMPRLQRRALTFTRYRADDLTDAPYGHASLTGLTAESFDLTLTQALTQAVFVQPARLTGVELALAMTEGGYLAGPAVAAALGTGAVPEGWWARSGRTYLAPQPGVLPAPELAFARAHFFQPHAAVDGFGGRVTLSYDALALMPVESVDPVGNRTTAGTRAADGAVQPDIDYRTLQPRMITDPNGIRMAYATDALGLVAGTALMGRPDAPTGDTLAGVEIDLSDSTIAQHLADFAAAPDAESALRLGTATSLIINDVLAYQRSRAGPAPQPMVALVHHRERHVADGPSPVRSGLAYADGFGRALQSKARADDGPLTPGGPPVAPRWVASGGKIYDNKGRVVRLFEPFFTATPAFEADSAQGVAGVRLYDPGDRIGVAFAADRTWTKTVRTAWNSTAWDANDLSMVEDASTDPDAGWMIGRLPAGFYLPSWGGPRRLGALGPLEKRAADLAALLADTPVTAYVDALGQDILARAELGGGAAAETRSVYEPGGEIYLKTDALGRIAERYRRDLMGRPVLSETMDGGARAVLPASDGQPVRMFDDRGFAGRVRYDAARRPTASFVTGADPARPGVEILVSRRRYGDEPGLALAPGAHLRGRLWKLFDEAGEATILAYDVHGAERQSARRLMADPDPMPDWSALAAADGDNFEIVTNHDALSRVTQSTGPDGSVLSYGFGRSGALTRVDYSPPGGAPQGLVTEIARDAHGRRIRVAHQNGAVSTAAYDPLTFRLREIRTDRAQAPRLVQLATYAYDAAGNVTSIRGSPDEAALFDTPGHFAAGQILVGADYRYDALGRLVEAKGREHEGQAAPIWADAFDGARSRLAHPQDGQRMRNYTESFSYDLAGNLKSLSHAAGPTGSYTRAFAHTLPSRIDLPLGPAAPGHPAGNRLSATTVGGQTTGFAYDAHGNMAEIGAATGLIWNHADQLAGATLGTGRVRYAYGATGERLRKHWRKSPSLAEERITLGGWEIWRRLDGAGQVRLARTTLHVSDGEERLALIERRAGGADPDPAPAELTRYRYADRLGSTTLELDATGAVISYEEYHPFGSTAYQAVRSALETPKRYRFSGKERDEETGLYCHDRRYYAPWLARWTSADPAGTADGANLYAYCGNNPVALHDPSGTSGLPKPEPILEGPLAPIIGDFPGWSSRWKQAAEKVLARKYGTKTFKEGMEAFAQNIETLTKTVGRGSNRQRGTAIYEARQTFKAVRAEFKVLMEAAGVSLKGVQVHHGVLQHLADVPEKALDATALVVAKGQAAVKGTSHNIAHAAEEAAKPALEAFKSKAGAVTEAVTEAVETGVQGAKSLVAAAQPAVKTLKKAPKNAGFVQLGLMKGIATVGLSVVGGSLSYQSLKQEIKAGDYGGAVSSAAGVLESGAALVATGAKALGVAGAGTSTTALMGTSVGAMGTGELIAAAPHVVGAFAVGALIGTGLEKGLKISEVAGKHGEVAEAATRGALQALGFKGDGDGAMYVGATAAAVSSITIAPVIAAQKRAGELGAYLRQKLF